jgi:hypothetical protein
VEGLFNMATIQFRFSSNPNQVGLEELGVAVMFDSNRIRLGMSLA